jgi:hypothetical protein
LEIVHRTHVAPTSHPRRTHVAPTSHPRRTRAALTSYIGVRAALLQEIFKKIKEIKEKTNSVEDLSYEDKTTLRAEMNKLHSVKTLERDSSLPLFLFNSSNREKYKSSMSWLEHLNFKINFWSQHDVVYKCYDRERFAAQF